MSDERRPMLTETQRNVAALLFAAVVIYAGAKLLSAPEANGRVR